MSDLRTVPPLRLNGVAAVATAVGAVAVGAFALGALVVGRLAIRRLAVERAAFKSLAIGDLTVDRLRAANIIVSDSLELPGARTRPHQEQLRALSDGG